jgi:deoxyribodipyrimidine photo-lyase
MSTAQIHVEGGFKPMPGIAPAVLPTLAQLGIATPSRPLPPGGEAAAGRTLEDFLSGRGRDYRHGLSSPLTAPESCSRLSAHLAFGTISMRSVHQATEIAIKQADPEFAHALRAFASRLRWHCHFMQKLEDEAAIEFRNFSRAHDGLRPGDGVEMSDVDLERLHAWREGRTGYPMVDACMRQLNATGWLNFRMRAMLVSFSAYHLWLHWREPGLHLARQFLDFEPGIHWSQMQMQSGTTGINTLRIYSPSKQARDHDPASNYVRQWVPEFGTPDYPSPVVNESIALTRAKEALYGLRKTSPAQKEADAISQKHGSRKSGLPPTARKSARSKARRSPRAEEIPGAPIQSELF